MAAVVEDNAEGGSLLEASSVIALVIRFLGLPSSEAGAAPPTAEERERAGEFVWDLSADAQHAATLVDASIVATAGKVLSAEDGDGENVEEENDDASRRREIALGIAANLASQADGRIRSAVLDHEEFVAASASCFATSTDPAVLREACRLWHVAASQDSAEADCPMARAANKEAFVAKLGFVAANALDASVLAAALRLAFALALWPPTRDDAFEDLVKHHGILDLAVATLAVDEADDDDGVTPDELSAIGFAASGEEGLSGLECALRLVEVGSLRADVAERMGLDRAAANLASTLLCNDRSLAERTTAVIALANLSPPAPLPVDRARFQAAMAPLLAHALRDPDDLPSIGAAMSLADTVGLAGGGRAPKVLATTVLRLDTERALAPALAALRPRFDALLATARRLVSPSPSDKENANNYDGA